MIKPKLNQATPIFLFFILALVLKGHAQTDFRPGYYTTWENDTVYGLIDYRSEIRNSKICEYRS